MEIRFDNQVALVTGASTGIGAAVARAFGEAGASVVVHYNRSQAAAQTVVEDIEAAGGTALPVRADVTRSAELSALVDQVMHRFGRIDILVNNAGDLVERVPIADISDETYHYIMDLNVTSVVEMCRLVIPIMKRQGHGNIINVTSIAARLGGGNGAVMYATSKGAISTFTRGLAKELAESNIRANALSPGTILTPFHERHTPQETLEAVAQSIPMKRLGLPEECAGTVLFLASEQLSGYITGQIIEVNGGQLMP